MSTTIESPNYAYPARSKGRRGPNLEKAGWIFMRASGVVLVVLIFGHLAYNLLWTPGGIRAIDFGFVGGKLADPFWQWWDVTMLWLAILHGSNGMRTIVNDYVHKPKIRTVAIGAIGVAAAVLIILGTLITFTFDPCPTAADPALLPEFCASL
ncbi:succinate dehydrogenase hydrophobic membrane anchor subunit [Agrococcus sediminis]|uniref:Succinate dehydrogenase hydrophobic membrane anchor subunit n=1 Tax=Agrococcus sediminis TaxID=2599924 RepID=A0A5M8Q7I6_9MICO|nr:succinate dehydrogenase hydrophobic membrane anchor subunit [Agrococcus sediminis]KAA6430894.1 succinate dehydrogenase hydrophobic membrane anchor subunit [Agrococcus sediminis]